MVLTRPAHDRAGRVRAAGSSSATGCSARARTGRRSARRSPTTTASLLVDMPDHGAVAVERAVRLPGRAPTRSPSCCSTPTTRSRWSATRWAARSRCWWRCATPSWSSGSSSSTSPRCPTTTPTEFDGYITAMRAIDLDDARARAEADAALQEAVPDPTVRGFLLQSLRARGRRLAVAAQPRGARPRPRRDHRLARGRGWPASRRTTGRCCGSAARRRATWPRSTSRRWTAGSRATAGSPSRAPATGCTASSREVFVEVAAPVPRAERPARRRPA